MGLFNVNVKSLKNKLSEKIPTNMKMIGSGTTSMLGDEIFRELHNKNLLLITDGNNDENSMDFRDIVTFAKKFNTSINAIKLEEKHPDNLAKDSFVASYTYLHETQNKILLLTNHP